MLRIYNFYHKWANLCIKSYNRSQKRGKKLRKLLEMYIKGIILIWIFKLIKVWVDLRNRNRICLHLQCILNIRKNENHLPTITPPIQTNLINQTILTFKVSLILVKVINLKLIKEKNQEFTNPIIIKINNSTNKDKLINLIIDKSPLLTSKIIKNNFKLQISQLIKQEIKEIINQEKIIITGGEEGKPIDFPETKIIKHLKKKKRVVEIEISIEDMSKEIPSKFSKNIKNKKNLKNSSNKKNNKKMRILKKVIGMKTLKKIKNSLKMKV